MSDKRPCREVLYDPTRGKLVFNTREIVRHPLRFLRTGGPFLTAHHPFCTEYEGHVFHWRGRSWCIGCFFSSISFAVIMLAVLLVWFFDLIPLSRFWLFYGGVAGVAISLLCSILHLTENKKVKAVAKILLGAAFAAMVWSVLIYEGFVASGLGDKIGLILFLYFPIITLMNARRMVEIGKTCQGCDYKGRWSRCPGLEDLLCVMVEEGFLHPAPKKEHPQDEPEAQ